VHLISIDANIENGPCPPDRTMRKSHRKLAVVRAGTMVHGPRGADVRWGLLMRRGREKGMDLGEEETQ